MPATWLSKYGYSDSTQPSLTPGVTNQPSNNTTWLSKYGTISAGSTTPPGRAFQNALNIKNAQQLPQASLISPQPQNNIFSSLQQAIKAVKNSSTLYKISETVSKTVKNLPEAHFADKTNFFTPLGFVAHVTQGLINTPAQALKGAESLGYHAGYGNTTPQQALGDVAAAAQLPLLFLTFGTSSVAKEGIVGAIKATAAQGVKGAVKTIGKEAAIGGGYGLLSGLQSGKDITNISDYLKNLLTNIGIGAGAAGTVGVVTHAVIPLTKGASNELGAIFIRNADKKPVVDSIQIAPPVAQHLVLTNNLESLPVGKAILKESLIAQRDNNHVAITPTDNGKYTIPNGGKVNISSTPIYNPRNYKESGIISPNGTKKTITQGQVSETTKNFIQNPQIQMGQSSQNQSQAPIGSGQVKPSTLGLRVQQTAIEKKITQDLGELPQYKQMNMKDQATKATDLLTNDPERAMRVALGQESAPQGLHPESIFKAVEASISSPEMAYKLANSPLVSEATALGQRIKSLDVKTSDSPVEAIRQVMNARQKAVESKLGITVTQATKDTINNIKKEVQKVIPKKEDWASFIRSIQC